MDQNQFQKKFLTLEYKTIEYQNGYYQGYLKNNLRHGLGFYFWDSGHLFFGNWENDTIQGNGILYYPKGGYFFGKFINNMANGYCQLAFQDGSSQQGIWKEGNLQGKCLSYKNNQWKYEEYIQNSVKVSSVSDLSKSSQMSLLSFILEKIFHVNNETKIDQTQTAFRYYHPHYNNIQIEINFAEQTLFLLANTDLVDQECGYGILHHNLKPIIRGYFQQGKLNGLGCILQEGENLRPSLLNKGQFVDINLQILDGIFMDGQFQYGVQYRQNDDISLLCQVLNGQINNISTFKGFTEQNLKIYKHPLKDSKFYFDKVTPCNLVSLSYLQLLQLDNTQCLPNSLSQNTKISSAQSTLRQKDKNLSNSKSKSKQLINSPIKQSLNNQNYQQNQLVNSQIQMTVSTQLLSPKSNEQEQIDYMTLLQDIQNRKKVFGDLKQSLDKFQIKQENQLIADYVSGQELETYQKTQNDNQDWKDLIIQQFNLSKTK
ncbi:hypothetical protein ABPG74_000503 [Tetrahymena malaccensis]